MAGGQLAKAAIINLVTNDRVVCMFNPTEYTFTKSNAWTEVRMESHNVPALEFGGGQPSQLDLDLFFDTYEAHAVGPLNVKAGEDVRQYTKGLWDMMKVVDSSTHKPQPPRVRFEWGSFWSFEAVVTSISQKFTFFATDGTPLRATLRVSLLQIKEEGQYPRQNPTSGGRTGEQVHLIREGETLAFIAYQRYGDSNHWRYIAQTNNLEDPRHLQPGRSLVIYPLPNQ